MGFFSRLFGIEERGKPPDAQRVAARAMVLAAVACRADLERDLDEGVHNLQENELARQRLLQWIKDNRLKAEFEPEESRFLKTPMAQAPEQTIINGGWRGEGLAVLAWALQLFELPPYDTDTDQRVLGNSIGLFRPDREQDLRRSAVLRPLAEIRRFDSHITIVSWRLRQFRLSRDAELDVKASGVFPSGRSGVREPMDFAGYLRAHPRFKESWFEGLRLINGDLALGDLPIAESSRAEVDKCRSIAVERQIAAYWLQGDDRTYSKVNPVTFLSAC